jgi:hypothetical protein
LSRTPNCVASMRHRRWRRTNALRLYARIRFVYNPPRRPRPRLCRRRYQRLSQVCHRAQHRSLCLLRCRHPHHLRNQSLRRRRHRHRFQPLFLALCYRRHRLQSRSCHRAQHRSLCRRHFRHQLRLRCRIPPLRRRRLQLLRACRILRRRLHRALVRLQHL